MNAHNITIRALREDDWQVFRAIRLEALQNHPGFFGRSYDTEAGQPPDDWKARLCNPGCCMFGLFDGADIIGLTGVLAHREDTRAAVLIASYIRAAYRGRGLSEMLYRARFAWVLSQPQFDRVVVSHRASNDASRMANQKWGFRQVRRAPHTWPDGASEDEVFYELARDEIAALLG